MIKNAILFIIVMLVVALVLQTIKDLLAAPGFTAGELASVINMKVLYLAD